MKMKKLIYLLTAVIAATILMSSCESILNYEDKMNLSSENALTSTFGLQTALIGAYDRIQSGDLYGGNIQSSGEFLAGNVKRSGEGNIVYEETQLLDKILTPDNRISASMWSNAYYTINLVNTIIEAIPNVNDAEIVKQKDRITGEALFIRAIMHYELVRYFGNPKTGSGVPLMTKPSGIEAKPARNTIEEVYNQVIEDLKKAIELLPATNENRATTYAASAILSRVYFYHEDYALADSAATYVINSGMFELSDSIPLNYQEIPTKENIFSIMSVTNDYSCGTLNGYYRKASGGKFSPSQDFIFLMSTDGGKDKRFSQFFTQIDNKWFTTKYDNKYMSVAVIRLAELYLIRGESRLMNADPVGALADYNMVRERAGLDPRTSVTDKNFYVERTRELAFEGDNFFNMKRLKRKIAGYDWNDRKLLFLIPQRELDVNPNLVQN